MSLWKSRQIGDIADSVDYGVTASATNQPVGPKFLRITDIQNGTVHWDDVPWCECDSRAATDARLASGDIVFAHTGATTGKSFLIRDCPRHAVFASYLIRVRLGESADPSFVSHFFQTPTYWAQITKGARGVAQPGVNATTLKSLHIPLPSLPEQRRLAAILDKADALRAKRRTALAQLDTLTQSIFLDMFGDPVTNRDRWPRLKLSELCNEPDDIKCGPFGTQLAKREFTNAGIPLWGIKNVNANFKLPTHEFVAPRTADRLSQYSINPGDIVMTRKGTVGNFAVYPDDFPAGIMHSDLLRLRVSSKKCHAAFVAHQLHHSRDVERQMALISGGAIMPGINVTKLKYLEIIVPHVSSQQDFSNRVAAVERIRVTYRRSLAELDALFASLQHRAFRGEL